MGHHRALYDSDRPTISLPASQASYERVRRTKPGCTGVSVPVLVDAGKMTNLNWIWGANIPTYFSSLSGVIVPSCTASTTRTIERAEIEMCNTPPDNAGSKQVCFRAFTLSEDASQPAGILFLATQTTKYSKG